MLGDDWMESERMESKNERKAEPWSYMKKYGSPTSKQDHHLPASKWYIITFGYSSSRDSMHVMAHDFG